MKIILRMLAALALATMAVTVPATAADKPLVIENAKIRELPAATTLQLQAPTTGAATVNLPHGTAPSSPTNGDCWTTTGGLYCRINGATVGPYGISGSVAVQDEGSAQGTATTLNFVGAGVSATAAGGVATVTVPGAGGGSGTEVLLNSVTVSGSASPVVFGSGLITSTYKTYRIRFRGVVGSAALASLQLQYSPDNGTTWRTTNYNGTRELWQINSTFSAKSNTSTGSIPVINELANDATYLAFGEITIDDPTNASIKKLAYGRGVTKSNDGNRYEYICSGELNTVEAHNAIRLILSTGNLTGTFSLFGVP